MLESNHLISFYLYLYINIIHYFLHYVKRFVLYFCKSFWGKGLQSAPLCRSSFFPFSNLSARILLGTLWFPWLYRTIKLRYQLRRISGFSTKFTLNFRTTARQSNVPDQPEANLFFYFYFLYNYYTTSFWFCQQNCSLILKNFLNSPALINWATNYLLLTKFCFAFAISCRFNNEASW